MTTDKLLMQLVINEAYIDGEFGTVRDALKERRGTQPGRHAAEDSLDLIEAWMKAMRQVVLAARGLWEEMDDISVRPEVLDNFRDALDRLEGK